MILIFFNDTATTEIYTLSLHDALPIWGRRSLQRGQGDVRGAGRLGRRGRGRLYHRGKDRKSTRLNSSHANISYAVFCLKKKILFSQLFLLTLISDIHFITSSPVLLLQH